MHIENRMMGGVERFSPAPPPLPTCRPLVHGHMTQMIEEPVIVASVPRGIVDCAPIQDHFSMRELALGRNIGEFTCI